MAWGHKFYSAASYRLESQYPSTSGIMQIFSYIHIDIVRYIWMIEKREVIDAMESIIPPNLKQLYEAIISFRGGAREFG